MPNRTCLLALLLPTCLGLGACGSSSSPAEATCARREECGNSEGLTLAECTAIEEDYLQSLGSQRGTCEQAYEECLGGAICDDFRECRLNIGPDVCGCPDVFVRILDPIDGQTITGADDADPSDATIQYDVVVEAGCLGETEQVELFLLQPVESSYGFGAPDARGRATIRVPFIPGTNRFLARGSTMTTVTSSEVTVTVSP